MVPVAELVSGFLSLVEAVAALKTAALAFFLGDRAFSAQLPKRLDTLLCFIGDFAGPGVAPTAAGCRTLGGLPPGVARGMVRMLVEAGERTLELLLISAPARGFFLGASESVVSPLFSWPSPEISLLGTLVRTRVDGGEEIPNLVLLGGRPGPGREDAVA